MNILHLTTTDMGGAGKAAYRLHQNVSAFGFNSKIIVMTTRSDNNDIITLHSTKLFYKIRSNFEKCLLKIRTDPKYYFQNQNRSSVKKADDILNILPFKPDIIVARWITNFLTIEDLYRLSLLTGSPVIWYMVDMAPLTGGCHYAWDCTGFMNQCGHCPALYSNENHDLSYRNWKKKHDIIQKMQITIVSATDWLNQQAKKATVFNGRKIEQIMLGLDTEIFKPVPRELARAELKLPLKQKIIFLGAKSLKVKRKGTYYLIEALKLLKKQLADDKNKTLIITAGKISAISPYLMDNFKHKHLGPWLNDRMLAKAYQAADVFVCPSIEDSGPMMINESIMCGTPVVTFEMGVALNLVHTGRTGYRAKLKDSKDLAKGIRYVLSLSPKEAKNMSEQCSKLGLKCCHHKVQAHAFSRLFELLVN
jgi:glycosyltransferase involved in cell wall biosynthesis